MSIEIEKINYWVQQALPQVYDDSLSFYELLSKVIAKVNEITDEVNEYFAEDIEVHVETVLIEWKNDGTLANIINNTVFTDLNNRMTALETTHTTDKNATNTRVTSLETNQITGNPNKAYKIYGGAIRNDGSGWTIINDSAHQDLNFSGIALNPTDDNQLKLTFDVIPSKVGTMVVTPDETFSKIGLVAGVSGGKDYSLIEMAAPLFIQTRGSTVIESGHKYHIPTTSITPLGDGTGYTLTHEPTSTTQPPMATISEGGGNALLGGTVRTEFTLTTTKVKYYQFLHGYVRYNGTSWDHSTDNVDKATISWDTVNNAVEVLHGTINEDFAVSISPAGSYMPYIYTQTPGRMLIRFKNTTSGADVLNPDTNMKFNYVRFDGVLSSMPSDMRVNIHRGLARVKPASVVEAFGNFWIMGISEL